ncbi:MAG: peptidoglycan-binding domain-containing protein [Pseudomonadota bacterium]
MRRLAPRAVRRLDGVSGPGAEGIDAQLAAAVTEKVRRELAAERAGLVAESSALMIDDAIELPTAGAVLIGGPPDQAGRRLLASLWLGDVHAYAWEPGGLRLLTFEDAARDADRSDLLESAFTSDGRYRDRPMGAAIHAGPDWTLRHALFPDMEVRFAIACSDGVYAAYAGPMAFEMALLQAVVTGRDPAGAARRLASEAERRKSDDASFAFATLSDDWRAVQSAADRRLAALERLQQGDAISAWRNYAPYLLGLEHETAALEARFESAGQQASRGQGSSRARDQGPSGSSSGVDFGDSIEVESAVEVEEPINLLPSGPPPRTPTRGGGLSLRGGSGAPPPPLNRNAKRSGGTTNPKPDSSARRTGRAGRTAAWFSGAVALFLVGGLGYLALTRLGSGAFPPECRPALESRAFDAWSDCYQTAKTLEDLDELARSAIEAAESPGTGYLAYQRARLRKFGEPIFAKAFTDEPKRPEVLDTARWIPTDADARWKQASDQLGRLNYPTGEAPTRIQKGLRDFINDAARIDGVPIEIQRPFQYTLQYRKRRLEALMPSSVTLSLLHRATADSTAAFRDRDAFIEQYFAGNVRVARAFFAYFRAQEIFHYARDSSGETTSLSGWRNRIENNQLVAEFLLRLHHGAESNWLSNQLRSWTGRSEQEMIYSDFAAIADERYPKIVVGNSYEFAASVKAVAVGNRLEERIQKNRRLLDRFRRPLEDLGLLEQNAGDRRLAEAALEYRRLVQLERPHETVQMSATFLQELMICSRSQTPEFCPPGLKLPNAPHGNQFITGQDPSEIKAVAALEARQDRAKQLIRRAASAKIGLMELSEIADLRETHGWNRWEVFYRGLLERAKVARIEPSPNDDELDELEATINRLIKDRAEAASKAALEEGGARNASRENAGAAAKSIEATGDAPRAEDEAREAVATLDVAVIKGLQTALRSLGFLDGEPDGDFGSRSRAALAAYRKAFGIQVSSRDAAAMNAVERGLLLDRASNFALNEVYLAEAEAFNSARRFVTVWGIDSASRPPLTDDAKAVAERLFARDVVALANLSPDEVKAATEAYVSAARPVWENLTKSIGVQRDPGTLSWSDADTRALCDFLRNANQACSSSDDNGLTGRVFNDRLKSNIEERWLLEDMTVVDGRLQ